MSRAHASNGLLVDPIYAKMRCRPLCVTLEQAPQQFQISPNGPVNGVGLTPEGYLLTGTGTPAGPSQLGSDQVLQTFLSVGVTSGNALTSITESGRAFIYVPEGQDWTFNFGAALLQGVGPITDKYDVALTIEDQDGNSVTLSLEAASGTPQAYNWVATEDPDYIIVDSATNPPANTVSQNSSRVTLLQQAGLLPGTDMYGTFTLTLRRFRKADSQVQTHVLTVISAQAIPQPGPEDSRAGAPTITGLNGNRVVTVAGEPTAILLRAVPQHPGMTLNPYNPFALGRGWIVGSTTQFPNPNPTTDPAYIIEVESDGTIGIEFGHVYTGENKTSVGFSVTPFEVQDNAIDEGDGRYTIQRTPASTRPFRLPAGIHQIKIFTANDPISLLAAGLGIRLWNLTE